MRLRFFISLSNMGGSMNSRLLTSYISLIFKSSTPISEPDKNVLAYGVEGGEFSGNSPRLEPPQELATRKLESGPGCAST